ncbi:MAG: tRNA (adenosine(37)-N6)-threonylcarbamoyltransferase complex transferase subunit TsaD [Defluviitaleaceae bacterium]|nr:tRNA (adenosine(37)-N6)-threonylcarbamoyltransferase complex transferase subunit TsaD [Defluviitaleaceae bacterium]
MMNKILAIETSCDETSAAIVADGKTVLSNIISSQIDTHKIYGGVVPEIASRKHVETISAIVDEALSAADTKLSEVDAIAVTYGPGLVGAVLIGLSYAKGLSFSLKKPLIGINHIEGHIASNYIENPDFAPPFICLVVSGGHTYIVHVKDFCDYEVLGKTRDDAAGEAFDKVARAVGLGYPGGPKIDKAATTGDKNAIKFPRIYLEEESYDFSFSGLKSAVLNYLNKCNMMGQEININDVAASFQQAAVEVLVNKTISAAIRTGVSKIALAGGVAANTFLRHEMSNACAQNNMTLNVPKPVYCTDNAAMIACQGYFRYLNGEFSELDLNAVPGLGL